MTDLQKWYNAFEENHKDDPIYTAEAISVDLAMRISSRLEELEINQKTLAKTLEVNKSYVSQILQGQNNMTILTICKIAAALNMKADVSFEIQESVSKQNFDPCVPESELYSIPNSEQDSVTEGLAAKVRYVGDTITDSVFPSKLATASY